MAITGGTARGRAAVLLCLSVVACDRNAGLPDAAQGGREKASQARSDRTAADYPADSPGTVSDSSSPDSSIRAKIDDSVITTKVKAALIANDGIDGSDISVETRSGDVALTGTAGSEAQVERAIKLARDVDGVRSVTSRITVKK